MSDRKDFIMQYGSAKHIGDMLSHPDSEEDNGELIAHNPSLNHKDSLDIANKFKKDYSRENYLRELAAVSPHKEVHDHFIEHGDVTHLRRLGANQHLTDDNIKKLLTHEHSGVVNTVINNQSIGKLRKHESTIMAGKNPHGVQRMINGDHEKIMDAIKGDNPVHHEAVTDMDGLSTDHLKAIVDKGPNTMMSAVIRQPMGHEIFHYMAKNPNEKIAEVGKLMSGQ